MAQLPSGLKAQFTGPRPWVIVLMVVALQLALGLLLVLIHERSDQQITQLEWLLVVGYSIVAIGIAIAVGYSRHFDQQREDRIRQRLLEVIEALPDPSAVRDVQGKYVLWNQAAVAYHGIKTEHVIGKTPFELFPKEVARAILELDHEAMMSNQTVVKRVSLPPLYGKGARVAQIRVAPIHTINDPNKVRGAVTILHDVTQSERESTALLHTTLQLRMALETSGFGSWIWNLDTDEVTFSEQYQQLLRYNGQQFKQDFQFKSRLHPDDLATVQQAMRRSFKENVAFDEVYRLRCFDDEYRAFHASGEVASDAQGNRYFAGLLCPLDRNESAL
ncbi:MAG: PAS domain-containing protein [Brachymonas sp.]|nr:PAS domain-containing protein [Brachymonas sp.]